MLTITTRVSMLLRYTNAFTPIFKGRENNPKSKPPNFVVTASYIERPIFKILSLAHSVANLQ